MSGSNDTVSSTKGKSTLVRPRFGPGMLLQHDDLEQLTSYTRDLSRLLFRSFFGCGVVCGLKVTIEENCGKLCVSRRNRDSRSLVRAIRSTCRRKRPFRWTRTASSTRGELWVVLCGVSKCCSPRTATCPTDDDETPSVCTRERDWFEIKVVRKRPECVCGCEPGPSWQRVPNDCQCIKTVRRCRHRRPRKCASRRAIKDHYDGKCGCDCDDCDGDCGDCILLAHLTLDMASPGWWTTRCAASCGRC